MKGLTLKQLAEAILKLPKEQQDKPAWFFAGDSDRPYDVTLEPVEEIDLEYEDDPIIGDYILSTTLERFQLINNRRTGL